MTIARAPLANLPTHDVFNMPPPIGDQDFWADDVALRQWTATMGADWGNPAKLIKIAKPRMPKTIEGTAARLEMFTSIRSVNQFFGANSSK